MTESANEHVQTTRCGFDRNASITEDCYVCECGWRDEPEGALLAQKGKDNEQNAAQDGADTTQYRLAQKSADGIQPVPAAAPQATALSREDLIYRLRERARIRRKITTRKSVQEGKPDRIADLLEEAADTLLATAQENEALLERADQYLHGRARYTSTGGYVTPEAALISELAAALRG